MADLYAIVGDMERARLMLAARVPYLQLRFKQEPLAPHRAEIESWAQVHSGTRIVVNDDLALAAEFGVWGAHLGQEDLDRHDPAAVRAAPLRVGISTHDDAEIGRALDCGAALLGFGPIFDTATKQLQHAPQGVARLADRVRGAPLPLIAIGGIDAGNLAAVADTGVPMVAMISYLDRFTTPAAIGELMAALHRPGIQGPR